MPKGAYTAKQERKADHIEKSYEKRGVSKKEAEERAWRTVNKQDKGGKNEGSRPLAQPQRRRQEGLGDPPPPRPRLSLASARGFRSRARSRATRCGQVGRGARRAATPLAATRDARGPPRSDATPGGGGCRDPGCVRPARRERQAVDRAADRRSAAPDRGSDLVESRWLAPGDRRQQLAPRPVGALGGAIGHPIVSDGVRARRDRGRCRSPEHRLQRINVLPASQHCV